MHNLCDIRDFQISQRNTRRATFERHSRAGYSLLFGLSLQLTMFTALLRNFFEFGVIILFIIFQPEIRKALEQIGRSKLGGKFKIGVSPSSREDEMVAAQRKAIEAVASAAMFFKRRRQEH